MKFTIKTITYLGNATMLTMPFIIIAGLVGVAAGTLAISISNGVALQEVEKTRNS